MKRNATAWVAAAVLTGVLASGCGPITAGSLMRKGGMWVAKEAAKKSIKHMSEDGDDHHKDDERKDRGKKRSGEERSKQPQAKDGDKDEPHDK